MISIMRKTFLFLIIFAMISIQCEEDAPQNPFDQDRVDQDSTQTDTLAYASHSLIGLQNNIFTPTCANSGCHDGTFEPDFRTFESSYNTLIYHPIIKNDPQGNFEYRVVPFNPDQSVLMTRLLVDIDGQSGIMPLTSQDSDWNQNRASYINDIRTWIENGAPDALGNIYSPVDNKPQILGVIGRANGVNLARGDAGNGPILLPVSEQSISFFVAIKDDNTSVSQLSDVHIKLAEGPVDFTSSRRIELNEIGTKFDAEGFAGEMVEYNYSTTLDLSSDTLYNENRFYFRVYANDGVNAQSESPSENSALYLKRYFSVSKI